ncbi:unnamed protein product [Fraxinus pennsylvanica]|uniref:Uncharacterized protein n=1 Tax=Fraxinus pennsylvanica TaxID=56036 RepID=A0AAD2AGP1_9LAMI|nr:unnamed protein product [Fraxinus pennsylvanica]
MDHGASMVCKNFQGETPLDCAPATLQYRMKKKMEENDYIFTLEYGTIFGELMENENATKGSRPAAKYVVENTPLVELTKDEMGENNDSVVCTVHCILPWLKIRNTCPVCRYELPTADVDYEKRKTERSGAGIASRFADDLQARNQYYILFKELLPK